MLIRSRREDFTERAMQALLQVFPPPRAGRVRAEERTRLRARVEYGIDRAASYGIHSGRDVFRYLCLMMRFGDDFDVDPAHPWAAEILSKRRRHITLSMPQLLFDEGRRRA